MTKLVITKPRIKALFIILCSLVSVSACSSAPIMTATYLPSSTYASRNTPAPTETIAPTLTPTPTATPIPTNTPTPIPLLTSKALSVVRSEHFDSLSTLSFSMYGVGISDVNSGNLILTDKIATNGNPWADGEAAGRSNFSPQVGNVSVFLFMADNDTYFGFHYELYENTEKGVLYRGVNLDSDTSGLSLHIDQGYGDNHAMQRSMPVTHFKRGVWYLYSLQAQPDGLFTAQIWERDQPANMIFSRSFHLDTGWVQPGFTFVITAYQGKMEIDEYQEIELMDAK